MNTSTACAQKVSAFLGRYGFTAGCPDVGSVTAGLLYDMQQALDHKSGSGAGDGVEAMIPVWRVPPSSVPRDKTVIVIDAGGTNFRSCLVSFDSSGIPSISELQKTSMPATDREYSRKEFFAAIAGNLSHLKNRARIIGFCFSYAMEIQPDGDGKVVEFSKEIKASDVIGSLVGKSLSDALAAQGWQRPDKIVMLNDTTAALMAGAVYAGPGRRYSSYAGFILGTGMNSAYIESAPIAKIAGTAAEVPDRQIVVCEVGSYDRLPKSLFDIEFEKTSRFPGRFIMEKMCAGGYIGSVASAAVRHACEDGLFSPGFVTAFMKLNSFSLFDMDRFLYTPYDTAEKLAETASHGIPDDYDTLYLILDAFIERSARLTAASIAAAVIKSGQGTSPVHPVCVLCNGTTFHKTHGLKSRVMTYLAQVLTQEHGLYFDIAAAENDITLGTAAAALS